MHMFSKERILTALSCAQPDKVPIFEPYISNSIIVDLGRNFFSIEENIKDAIDVNLVGLGESKNEMLDLYCLMIEELGLDATNSFLSVGLEEVNENYIKDKYGRVSRLSKHGTPFPVEGPIKCAKDLAAYNMVSKLKSDDFSAFQYIAQKIGKTKAHFLNISDPFKISWLLRGSMQRLLMDYLQNPQLVHDLALIATDYDIAVIDMASDIIPDVNFFMGGDLAGETNTIMSPKHYKEYVKPYEKQIVDYAHSKGAKIVRHTDGNVWPILGDFVEVGFDGFHPVQPQCMKIAEVKEYLAGGKMCVIGNIDCRNLLPFGTEAEVEQSVKKTIEKAAPGGGYIISSSSSIHPDVKPGNFIAMVEAAHKYGKY